MLLPNDEVGKLLSCSGDVLSARVRALRLAGWTLASIAAAWDPPKSRSSIKSLATKKTKSHLPIVSSPSSSLSSSSSSTFPAAEVLHSRPAIPAPTRSHTRVRRFYDSAKPALTPAERHAIHRLAPVARRYRAKANPKGIYAIANNTLTVLCIGHYRAGVSVQELSKAAAVTYRAMARRIGVGK